MTDKDIEATRFLIWIGDIVAARLRQQGIKDVTPREFKALVRDEAARYKARPLENIEK